MTTYNADDDSLVCRKAAAKIINFAPGTLAVWDCTKRYDLKPIKFGRSVRYNKAYLLKLSKSGLLPRSR